MLWYKHPTVPHLIPHHSSQDVVTHLKHLARKTAHRGLGDFHWSSLTVNRAKVKKGSTKPDDKLFWKENQKKHPKANPAAYKLRSKKVWHLSVRIKCVKSSRPAMRRFKEKIRTPDVKHQRHSNASLIIGTPRFTTRTKVTKPTNFTFLKHRLVPVWFLKTPLGLFSSVTVWPVCRVSETGAPFSRFEPWPITEAREVGSAVEGSGRFSQWFLCAKYADRIELNL